MIDKKTFKLTIIIPCYNEKNTIEEILKRINESLKSYELLKFEVLIVDDFSNDGTKDVLKNFTNDEKIQIDLLHNICFLKFVLILSSQ